MKTKILFLLLFLFPFPKMSAQVFFNSPRNIKHAIRILDKKLSEETKNNLMVLETDSLLDWYKYSDAPLNFTNEWFVKSTHKSDLKDARLGKYYQKKGLRIPNDMIEVILRTYQQKLQGQPTNHEDILYQLQLKQLKFNEEDKVRFTTDSLRGNYIPINLEDCLRTLDVLYPDSLKVEIMNITEDEYLSKYHLFGMGVWMRNNWQLWGGSRLSKYFNHIGINHPDGMSGTIMRSYHRYLRNEDIRLEEQILRYHDFMEKYK